MAAAAHSKAFAKKVGIPMSVAKIAKYQRRVAVPRRWERIPEATEGPTA